KKEATRLGFELPEPGKYGVAFVFLPTAKGEHEQSLQILEDKVLGAGQKVLGWRDVPHDPQHCGPQARKSLPALKQLFIGSTCDDTDAFERKLYVIRKWAESTAREQLGASTSFYVSSISCRTIVYKGLLLAQQLDAFYSDFSDEDMVSALAMVHQRFSTNTFPTWSLAQPFHMLCHNGEINTVRGNVAWMKAREHLFGDQVFGEDIQHVRPVITPDASDSASLDNAVEVLFHGG